MKFLPVICLSSFCIWAVISTPETSYAYMTLFNDNGNWAAATRMDPENEKVVYRACKNSSDRNSDTKSEGSLAILCITVCPEDDTAILGVWHAESPAKPGEGLSCGIELDNMVKWDRKCKTISSRYITDQIVLSQDKKEIAKILAHKILTLHLENTSNGTALKSLEFDLDPEALRKAASNIYEFF